MELQQFNDAAEFYERTKQFLIAHEATHNLILGICAGLKGQPGGDQLPYLASITVGDAVVAAAVMTPPHNVVLSLTEEPDALPLFAADCRAAGLDLPGVLGPALVSRAFAELWCRPRGQPFRKSMALRIYQLDTVPALSSVPGRLRRATSADRDRLVAWLTAFGVETHDETAVGRIEQAVDRDLAGPTTTGLHVWDDGQPVSMAAAVGPTPHGIRINAVYTPPALRGRGYASACVAALSQLMLDAGRRYCFLFTDLSNPTSNHIYRAIGYEAVCDMDEYTFPSSAAHKMAHATRVS